ncbi:MAG: hypoxanthine phosphoribosyltransferase [Chloroflexi bacterium]|nr:hypoxanthine phosphoribosyltransferase [Chloroflexota bacterium]
MKEQHLKLARVLISKEELRAIVERLATEIRRDYQGRTPLLVGVLKGSFIFLADLVRCLNMPLEIEFVRLASYGAGTTSSGRVRVIQGISGDIRHRDILLVEDIVDTGLTISHLMQTLHRKGAASIRLCALLDKPSQRKVDIKVDYLGSLIPDEFVVGYGLDYAEQYRYLPAIYALGKED